VSPAPTGRPTWSWIIAGPRRAHRSPDLVLDYCRTAEDRGLKLIIAAAGMAAHLAGFAAAKTHLPVLAVPMPGSSIGGLDALLSMVQMPAGIPVATFAIGKAGAINAALFAAAMLAIGDPALRERLLAFRQAQTGKVLAETPLG
jgi:5-(carboxyamino)imidazole ribonucleotide mutase